MTALKGLIAAVAIGVVLVVGASCQQPADCKGDVVPQWDGDQVSYACVPLGR